MKIQTMHNQSKTTRLYHSDTSWWGRCFIKYPIPYTLYACKFLSLLCVEYAKAIFDCFLEHRAESNTSLLRSRPCRIGRHKTLLIVLLLTILSGFAHLFFVNYWAFVVIRFLQGMAGIASFMLCFVLGILYRTPLALARITLPWVTITWYRV